MFTCPLKDEASLVELRGSGPVLTSSRRLLVRAVRPGAAPQGSCWRNLSHQHTRPAGIPGLLCLFSRA